MAAVGLLAGNVRVELVQGEILDMPPINAGPASLVDKLNRLLVRAVEDRAIVRVHGTVCLDADTEVEPDIALLAPRADFYRAAHPKGTDTFLVIEVEDDGLQHVLDVELRLYARHGVPEVWVVDIASGELISYHRPSAGTYLNRSASRAPGVVPLAALPGVHVNLSELFTS